MIHRLRGDIPKHGDWVFARSRRERRASASRRYYLAEYLMLRQAQRWAGRSLQDFCDTRGNWMKESV